MKRGIFSGLLAVGLAAAQSAMETTMNPYSIAQHGPEPVKLILSRQIQLNSRYILYDLLPLTEGAYDQLPHGPDDETNIPGNAVLNTPGNDTFVNGNFPPNAMAYTSCNPDDYSGSISMNDVISQAIQSNVTALLFYTTGSTFCNVSELDQYNGYMSMYSMVNSSDAADLLSGLTPDGNYINNMAFLWSTTAYDNRVQQLQNSSPLSGGASTGVAMIILYSITGVITTLFLVIIITGAVRAHRHPERYGPRNVIGRPRQSRAKGIAKAMLDTLPIVKFGEKAEGKDVEEQGNSSASGQSTEMSDRSPECATEAQQVASRATAGETTVVGAAGATASESRGIDSASPESSHSDAVASSQPEEDHLGCSICTDDFELGQDIRVLPCNHQFHPACVDPWLLDVSGTCPLCRVDLNPSASAGAGNDTLPPPVDDAQPPPLSPRERSRAMLRAMLGRSNNGTEAPAEAEGLESPNREHRMAALRQWRQARMNRSEAVSPQDTAATTEASTSTPATTDEAVAPEEQQEELRRRRRLGALSRLVRRR